MALVIGLAWLLAGAEGAGESTGEPGDDITLVFGGDVALGRVVVRDGDAEVQAIGVPASGREHGGLSRLEPVLAGADLAVVNLECVLWEGALPSDGIRLIARPEAARVLVDAGVDVVSVANNHALDAGVAGLEVTEGLLAERGIAAVGAAQRVLVRELRGQRVAMLALTDRRNATTPKAWLGRIAYVPSAALAGEVNRAVREVLAEGRAEVVVVMLHWGVELASGPSRAQVDAARAAIDAGARVVIGHGAHLVQRVERYAGGVIFYSLGNLLFDMRRADTRRGALARVTIDARGEVAAAELIETFADPHTDVPAFVHPP